MNEGRAQNTVMRGLKHTKECKKVRQEEKNDNDKPNKPDV